MLTKSNERKPWPSVRAMVRYPAVPALRAVSRQARYQAPRLYVLRRDGDRCVYCGGVASETDHVIPRHFGGPGLTCNLVATCRRCNRKKSRFLYASMLCRALSHLVEKGEDVSWMYAYGAAVATVDPNELAKFLRRVFKEE